MALTTRQHAKADTRLPVPRGRHAYTPWGDYFNTHALANVALKVLLAGNVDTDGAVLEPAGGDLVLVVGDSRDDNVRDLEGLLEGGVHGSDYVVAVELVGLGSRRALGKLDNGCNGASVKCDQQWVLYCVTHSQCQPR